MVATIGESIQRTQSLYSKGVQSDDSRLSARQIYSVLKGTRSALLSQQANKNQTIPESNYQSLDCVEMVHVPLIKGSSKKILRSKNKIPNIVSNIGGLLIKDISSIDGNFIYDLIDFKENRYFTGGNKFTAKKATVYFKDEYLWLNNSIEVKSLTLRALFEDPIEPYLFESPCRCEECKCKDLRDFSFHLDSKTLKTAIDMANNELIIMFSQMKEDKSNDSSDNSESKGMVHQAQQPSDDN